VRAVADPDAAGGIFGERGAVIFGESCAGGFGEAGGSAAFAPADAVGPVGAAHEFPGGGVIAAPGEAGGCGGVDCAIFGDEDVVDEIGRQAGAFGRGRRFVGALAGAPGAVVVGGASDEDAAALGGDVEVGLGVEGEARGKIIGHARGAGEVGPF